MFADVILVLRAVIPLIGYAPQIAEWIRKNFGDRPEDAVATIADATKLLAKASSKEEKHEAAKVWLGIIRNINR